MPTFGFGGGVHPKFVDRHDSLALLHHRSIKKTRLSDILEQRASWTIGARSNNLGYTRFRTCGAETGTKF